MHACTGDDSDGTSTGGAISPGVGTGDTAAATYGYPDQTRQPGAHLDGPGAGPNAAAAAGDVCKGAGDSRAAAAAAEPCAGSQTNETADAAAAAAAAVATAATTVSGLPTAAAAAAATAPELPFTTGRLSISLGIKFAVHMHAFDHTPPKKSPAGIYSTDSLILYIYTVMYIPYSQ